MTSFPDFATEARVAAEGRFTPRALRPLFRPASIAVVGASNDPSRIGGRPLEYLGRVGYTGEVIGINPKYSTVQGYRCIPSIAEAPEGIDLYVLAIPAAGVPGAVTALGRRGGQAAIVFSGGFSEIGSAGEQLQRELRKCASKYGLPVLGPNCLGMVSFHDAIPATFSSSLRSLPSLDAGRVAIVSQSGGFAANLAVEAAVHGARFSYMLATGNEAVVDIGDVFTFLAADENTDAVVGYLEGVRDGSSLAFGLSQLQMAGKRVSLLKVGHSLLGAAAVGGHTALMSGADDSIDACFRRYGVTRLHTFDEMVDVAVAGSRSQTAKASGKLAVATISGGTAVYILDACEEFDVPLAQLSASTYEALEAILPTFARVGNPVDLTAQVINDPSTLIGSLELLSEDTSVGEILFFLGGQDDAADALLSALRQVRAVKEGRLSLAWLGVSERRRMQARDAGIKTYADPVRFLRTLSSATTSPTGLAERSDDIACVSSTEQGVATSNPRRMHSELSHDDFVTSPGGVLALDEWHGMTLLAEAGVQVPRQWQWNVGGAERPVPPSVAFPCVAKLLQP
ncbi:MAG: CoA-binding protein, partial [Thermomicrobiales bacterium]